MMQVCPSNKLDHHHVLFYPSEKKIDQNVSAEIEELNQTYQKPIFFWQMLCYVSLIKKTTKIVNILLKRHYLFQVINKCISKCSLTKCAEIIKVIILSHKSLLGAINSILFIHKLNLKLFPGKG